MGASGRGREAVHREGIRCSMSVEWEYEVLKLELWITWRFKSIEKEKFTKTKKKTEVG